MAIELLMDNRDDLRRVIADGEDVRLERVDQDHWFLRIGDHAGETLVVHLQTLAGSPEIRAFYSKETARR
jgi:hypothetical protein